MENIELLKQAIIIQATEDYREALHGRRIEGRTARQTIRELDKFFASDWYYRLTKIDGNFVKRKLQSQEKAEFVKAYTEILKDIDIATIKITLPKGKHGSKRRREERLTYYVPPRLMDGFIQVMVEQLAAIGGEEALEKCVKV